MMITSPPVSGSLPSFGAAIQYFKGVGPQKAELLAKVGIRTVEDVLYYYPRDHQDRRIRPVSKVAPGERTAILAEVLSVDFRQVGRQLGQAVAIIRDSSGRLPAVWFKHLSYRYDVFSAVKRDVKPGNRLVVFGLLEAGKTGEMELRVEDYDVWNPAESAAQWNRIVPVYPLTLGLYDKWLRGLTGRILEQNARFVADPLPAAFREAQNLIPLQEAIRLYHFPATWAERDVARERLAFDEFFFLELALALNRQEREQHSKGFQSFPRKTLLSPFKHKLGYEFTRAQTRAINEIFRDMERPAPMNRLLQGDVGSGKTVVALSAALLAIENERQAAFLAPTEILAEQHALSIGRFLSSLPVKWAVLTRSTPRLERAKILKDLSAGHPHLLVGTHAILNEDVRFKQLGLVIIDEQHRFGVRQRARLVSKTQQEDRLLQQAHPDILIMTATPIPRTLALTLYGDLDVSILDELPGGRTPVETSLTTEEEGWKKVEQAILRGHQAYVVFPLIEESRALSSKNGKGFRAATQEFARLKERFRGHNVGLLHGLMSGEEKRTVMDAFRRAETSILVSTPVIEVGIDVPNATVIAIVNPERFGLAQLHQLRGRVGRGPFPSECLLIVPEPKAPLNDRLDAFCAVSDGFRLAEEDLTLRGPGEFLGEAQHGVPFFRVGNLLQDGLLIARARAAAKTLVEGDLPLTMKEFGALNRELQKRFGSKIQLSRVG